jgi:hypothetical protein
MITAIPLALEIEIPSQKICNLPPHPQIFLLGNGRLLSNNSDFQTVRSNNALATMFSPNSTRFGLGQIQKAPPQFQYSAALSVFCYLKRCSTTMPTPKILSRHIF